MARSLMFRYAFGLTALHRIDLRVKVATLAILSAAAISAPLIYHPIFYTAVVVLWRLGRLSVREVARALAPFAGFLVLIAIPPFAGSPTPEREALRIGESASRFLILILSAHAMMRTTSPAQIGEAVEFFTAWFGPRFAHNAAVMAALVVSFLPQILDRAATLRHAASLRGWTVKRSALTLVRVWSFPLLRTLMDRSAWTAHSMELRAFRPRTNRPK